MMEKRTCANCAYRGSDGYCDHMGRITFDFEHCHGYCVKNKVGFIEYCMLGFIVMVLVCMLATVPGCTAPKDEAAMKEPVYLEVSDKPAPQTCEEQEPMDIESVEDFELEYEEVAAMDDAPRYEDCEQNHSVLTMSGGVNYYNGKRETWYSSNVLRHYRIGEWDAGDDGVWRDADGYIIIASSDMPMGAVHETSLGMAKVYDTGCPAGTVDIYVNW